MPFAFCKGRDVRVNSARLDKPLEEGICTLSVLVEEDVMACPSVMSIASTDRTSVAFACSRRWLLHALQCVDLEVVHGLAETEQTRGRLLPTCFSSASPSPFGTPSPRSATGCQCSGHSCTVCSARCGHSSGRSRRHCQRLPESPFSAQSVCHIQKSELKGIRSSRI